MLEGFSAILLFHVWYHASHLHILIVQVFPVPLLFKYILNMNFTYVLVCRLTRRASSSRVLQMTLELSIQWKLIVNEYSDWRSLYSCGNEECFIYSLHLCFKYVLWCELHIYVNLFRDVIMINLITVNDIIRKLRMT